MRRFFVLDRICYLKKNIIFSDVPRPEVVARGQLIVLDNRALSGHIHCKQLSLFGNTIAEKPRQCSSTTNSRAHPFIKGSIYEEEHDCVVTAPDNIIEIPVDRCGCICSRKMKI